MLKDIYRKILGKGSIDDLELKATLKELQRALLAADVDVPLVLEKTKAIEKRFKEERAKSLSSSKLLSRIVYEELKDLFGKEGRLPLKEQKIMLVGLYGMGKTTTAAKLAHYFQKRGIGAVLASADFDRPAGREQLRQLAEKVGAKYVEGSSPEEVVEKARDVKGKVVILDTAGRNALDEALLQELKEVYESFKPDAVVFVVGADVGSGIKKHLQRLREAVPVTGGIITRFEGSGRAGGALSAFYEEDVPVLFVGTGEKIEDLEEFSKEEAIKKMLGIPSLKGMAKELMEVKNLEPTTEFSLISFQQQMKALGGMSLGKLFGNMGLELPQDALIKGEQELKKMDAIINSMTPYERNHPEVVVKSPSRIRRIAKGSGTSEQEVKKLLKQFFKAKKLFKKMKRNRGMLGKLQQLMGG